MKPAFILLAFCLGAFASTAQELEPRNYTNLPKGMNVLMGVYGLTHGNVVADAALPITDFTLTTHSFTAGYLHTFGLFNNLARIGFATPFVDMTGNLKLYGQDTSGSRTGFGDTRIRMGINLLGSPALDPKEFKEYQQKTILGISLVTSIPTGLYYPEKLINIGSHRWAFKPEIGISRRFARFYAEGYIGVWFYKDNNQFLETNVLSQQPVYNLQLHAVYTFKNQMWIGIDGNWFNGGKTSVNGQSQGDLKDNKRLGAAFSYPFAKKHSLKLQFHAGLFKDIDYDYKTVSLSYQYIFF
jgi:hypothetical protein